MTTFVGHAQAWILLAISVALFVTSLYALINALRFRPDAYLAAGKRTKKFWGLLTGGSVLLAFLSLPYPLGTGGALMFMLGSGVITGLFLGDVLPALKSVMGRAQGSYRRR